jgi:hypothetical protein
MSVRTPILTTSSETCASAAGVDKIAAAKAASLDSVLAEITMSSRYGQALSASCLAGSLSRRLSLLQFIRSLFRKFHETISLVRDMRVERDGL